MNLARFTHLAALVFYLISPGFLSAASYNSDTVPEQMHSSPTRQEHDKNTFLIDLDEKEPEQPSQDLLLSVYERQQNETLMMAKQAEKTVEKQAHEIEDLESLLNPPVKPQPVYQTSSATTTLVKASVSLPQKLTAPFVPRPVVSNIVIPEVARGYEDIYRRFLGGKLIYTHPTSKAKTELPIRALANPLEGTFDLSGCGDTGKYLSIATGYRKGQKAENASRVEIWLAPWFLVNKNLSSSAKHLQPIMGSWDAAAAPVGLFWTWGGWSVLGWYDYLTTNSLEDISCRDMYENYKKRPKEGRADYDGGWYRLSRRPCPILDPASAWVWSSILIKI